MIREATFDDIPAVCSLLQRHHEGSEYACFSFDEGKLKADLRVAIKSANSAAWVAVDGDEIVGSCIGSIADVFLSRERLATSVCLLVDKERRNSAHGLWLLLKFKSWARSLPKVSKIVVGHTSGIGDQERVSQLLEKTGFTKYGGLYKDAEFENG